MVSGVLKMNKMLKTAGAAVLGAGLLLAGCVPVEPAATQTASVGKTAAPVVGANTEVPDELIRAVVEYGMASTLVRQCPNGLGLHYLHKDDVNADLGRRYGGSPRWMGDFRSQIGMQFQDYKNSYIQRRKIVATNQESWCAAGRAEIAEGTEIGRYLLEL